MTFKRANILIVISLLLAICVSGYVIFAKETSRETVDFDLIKQLTLDEEIQYFKQVIEEWKRPSFQLNDPELEKWILRTIASAIESGVSLTDNQIIEIAREYKQENDDFINTAQINYGIYVTDEVFDQYMSDYMKVWDGLQNMHEFAELLGMSVHELNYEFYRDLNTRTIVWQMLIPLLEEKYEVSEKYSNTDHALLEKYQEEINHLKNK